MPSHAPRWRPPGRHDWLPDRTPLDFPFDLGVTAWLGFVAVLALLAGVMIFHALTGSDRRYDWLAHHGRRASALVVRCDHVPHSLNRPSCTLRYAVDDRAFTVDYRNRGAQFRGLKEHAGEVAMLVDPRHPTTHRATVFDVENRSGMWQSSIAVAIAILVVAALVLLAPIAADYVPE